MTNIITTKTFDCSAADCLAVCVCVCVSVLVLLKMMIRTQKQVMIKESVPVIQKKLVPCFQNRLKMGFRRYKEKERKMGAWESLPGTEAFVVLKAFGKQAGKLVADSVGEFVGRLDFRAKSHIRSNLKDLMKARVPVPPPPPCQTESPGLGSNSS